MDSAQETIANLVQSDRLTPRYHFIAPQRNCMPFDPNGALFWQGRYHLFYIFQDSDLPHGGHSWGHASSSDLLNWKYHPTALAPATGDPEKGIFSGNAFVSKEGIPTLAYYGIAAGICLAQSTDADLNVWTKLPSNPVIPEPKEGEPNRRVYNVFDPHVWLEDETYYAILGGMVKPDDIRDTAYLFRSDDLIHWEYLRPFYQPNPAWTGEEEDCACPDFFKLGDRHVLLCISHARGTRCYLGRYENETFLPEEHHRMNWPGGSCFAPETLVDDNGRRIFWAWVPDQRLGNAKSVITDGLGVMTMPRVLSLDSAGRLLITPPTECESLRQGRRSVKDIAVGEHQEIRLDGIEGDTMELGIEAVLYEAAVFDVKVMVSPGQDEQTVISVDTDNSTVSIDTSQSSLSHDIFRRYPLCGEPQEDVAVQTAPFTLRRDEPLRLRIFLDRSILEVYANGRQCMTQRVYPTRRNSDAVFLFCRKGSARVRSADAYTLC